MLRRQRLAHIARYTPRALSFTASGKLITSAWHSCWTSPSKHRTHGRKELLTTTAASPAATPATAPGVGIKTRNSGMKGRSNHRDARHYKFPTFLSSSSSSSSSPPPRNNIAFLPRQSKSQIAVTASNTSPIVASLYPLERS